MIKMEKVGIISGKFRLLHKGHKEALIRASFEKIDKLLVIIDNSNDYKRYSTVENLNIAINETLQGIDHLKHEVIVCSQDVSTIEKWEAYVIDTVGHQNIVMFNSKEDYKNKRLENKFIKCPNSIGVSSTEIEREPFNYENYANIANEFKKFMNRKIVLSGVESSGKTQFAKKLAGVLNTNYSPEYGRYYASERLGGNDNIFTPKDFIFIAMEQIKRDRSYNINSNRILIVDTDPYVTLRFLNSYYEEYKKRGILNGEFVKEFEDAKLMLDTICRTYKSDITILLTPDVPYVKDGIRWEEQEQNERIKHYKELKEIYEHYNVKYVEVNGEDYKERFNKLEEEVAKII